MKRTDGVTLRCGLRDAKKWLNGVRGRKVVDPMDSRRHQFQTTIAYADFLALIDRCPHVEQYRVYFGDEVDVPVSLRLEELLAART